jgi:hypothetical protein
VAVGLFAGRKHSVPPRAAPGQPIRMRMLEPGSTNVPQHQAPSMPSSAVKREGTAAAAGLFAGRKHTVPPESAPCQPVRMRMLAPGAIKVPRRQATSAPPSTGRHQSPTVPSSFTPSDFAPSRYAPSSLAPSSCKPASYAHSSYTQSKCVVARRAPLSFAPSSLAASRLARPILVKTSFSPSSPASPNFLCALCEPSGSFEGHQTSPSAPLIRVRTREPQ